MTDAQALIDASGLRRRYGPHLAVDGLDLTLKRGEVLGLLGPNGAGKTTTLRMLAGSLAPHQGDISICGIDLRRDPEKARTMLGYLPETPPLHAELTVDEYLLFCARLRGIRGSQGRQAVAEARAACGLDPVARQVIGSLSKGFQQRVGLAQAIVHKPPVVILDEPTVGLDPNQIREIRTLIRRLSRTHGVILSSHILPEVQSVCSRLMIIAAGRIAYSGTLDKLDSDAGAQEISLVLGQPPTGAELEQLPGVVAVTALEGGHFRLSMDAGSDHRAQIAAAAVAADWELLEIYAEHAKLETLFARLTGGDPQVNS